MTRMGLMKKAFWCALLVHAYAADDCASNEGFKDGAETFGTLRRRSRRSRRGRRIKNKVEIIWRPQSMLKDSTCYAVGNATLEMQQGGSVQWNVAQILETKSWGPGVKFTVETKPCLKYHFRIKVSRNTGNKSEASLILGSIAPKNNTSILNDGYKPDAPTGFRADVSQTSAVLRWNPSDCATEYRIEVAGWESGEKSTGNATAGNVTDLKPCTRYDATIYAIGIGGEYSDELSAQFETEPRRGYLKVNTTPLVDSVKLSWPAGEEVACIDEYKVKACTIANIAKCTKEERVKKINKKQIVNHEVKELISCTDYKLHIQPTFKDLNLDVEEVEFRTTGDCTNYARCPRRGR